MQTKDQIASELAILGQFVQSDGWQLLKEKWQPLLDLTMSALISGTCENREFLAGKANVLTNFMEWPTKRIQDLQKKLVEAQKLG